MNKEQLVEYYADLLILQYKNKPKAREHIKSILNKILIFDIIHGVERGYDIEEEGVVQSTGKQLDTIGKYVGVSRQKKVFIFETYFGSRHYKDIDANTRLTRITGARGYDAPFVESQIWTYLSQFEYELGLLSDQELWYLLRMKSFLKSSNLSTKDIDVFFRTFFGNGVLVTEAGNMALNYVVDASKERLIQLARDQNLLPKPAAVSINVVFYHSIPFGGLIYNTEENPIDVAGFNTYDQEAIGTVLSY